MPLQFFLIVNRHGQTRLAQYYTERPKLEERQKLENELIRQCIGRNEDMSFTFRYGNLKIIYKRYLAIYAIAGVDDDYNELEALSLFDFYFQTLSEYFGTLTESHILYNEAQSYAILNEIVVDGEVVETARPIIISFMNSAFPNQ